MAAISAGSFEFLSEMGGGQGAFLAAAHVQGIDPGDESGWIGAIPEPGTAGLVGLDLLVFRSLSRRRH